MAETVIVSPGVFTRENDLSYLPQGLAQIGAAVVGPTQKGPAFVPTVVKSFAEFERKFGSLHKNTYVPQTVKEYLKNATSVLVCRVLSGGGYKFETTTSKIAVLASGSNGNVLVATIDPSKNESSVGLEQSTLTFGAVNKISNSFNLKLTGSSFTSAKQVSASFLPTNTDYIEKVLGNSPENSKTSATNYDSSGYVETNFKALQTAIGAASIAEVSSLTFGTSASEIFVTSSLQDDALGGSGSIYLSDADGNVSTLHFSSSNGALLGAIADGSSGSIVYADLTSTAGADGGISASGLATVATTAIDGLAGFSATATNNVVTITAAEAGNITDITTTFAAATASVSVDTSGAGVTGYDGLHANRELTITAQSATITYTSSFGDGYQHASTPFITSQLQSGVTQNLFKLHILQDGAQCNTDYKVSITNLKEPADIDNEEQYSTFSVLLREYGDKDKTPVIVEQYNNVNLNPNDVNFISRRIGDRYGQYNDTLGTVEYKGNFPNISNYIRVEVATGVEEMSYSPKLSPKGFKAPINPIPSAKFTTSFIFPSASYKNTQTLGGSYNASAYHGWQFDDEALDNKNFLKPLPSTEETNVSGDFNIDNLSGHPSASWNGSLSASIDSTGVSGPQKAQLKFSVCFQGGSDGINPSTIIKNGEQLANTNAFGFDLSTTSAVGYKGYKKALDILSNQDEYDINMLVLPGVIKNLHSSVTSAAIDMAEGRGDCFYVMDLSIKEASVATAVTDASGLDTNYAAVYYPWVKVLDTSQNKPVFVPPSVVVPGAIAASDAIGAEWFAPAGLNRGILGNVLEARQRLSQSDRDRLYEDKINPIATFPQTGVCIWGQKTLQERSTALDRINVRRLMIALKKFIASSSRYLVFEQNTFQTRNRFLNIVNPYLESVQSRQGLFAFRVVMDESNNTPDVIDRNQVVGQIFLQPTKTAEYIILDFTVLPTGATFDNGGSAGSTGGGGY